MLDELSQRRYQLLAERALDIVLFFRFDDGRLLDANEAALAAYGFTREELLSRTVFELRDRPDDGASLAELTAGAERGIRFETVHRRKDGTTFEIEASVRAATLEDTRLLVSVIRDISERKAAEARERAAERARREVEARAEEERAALQARLAQAAKLEAVGRLAGGIAHDFNNLLTAILSVADALDEDLVAGRPASLEDVRELRAAAIRARDLTGQLLAFARRQAVALEALDLAVVLSGVEKLLRRLVGDGIELVVRTDPGLWPVRADAGQLERVLLNLAVNARDAMPSGGRLTIDAANETVEAAHAAREPGLAAGGCVRVSVSDTGAGMPDEVKARAFEPFFTTKEGGKGSGLGLATVYGIVQQLGGAIRLESAPGRGTRIEVRLPRLE